LGGVAGLVLVLATMALVLVQNIAAQPKISYLDEPGHGDYLYQASHGGMAQLGERLGPEITREMACRGVQALPEPTTPCPGDGDPANVPGWDYTTADVHPPTYYYVTAALGRAVLTVAPTDSLITAGRLVNVVWFGGGLVLLYLLLRELGARVSARLAVCLLIALTPVMIQHMSVVSVTATAFPAAALLTLAAVRWERRRALPVALVAAAVLCVALKADNLVPVLAVCGYLLVRAVVLRREGLARRYVAVAAAVALAAVVTEVVWLAVRQAVALGGSLSNPGTVIFYRTELRPDDLVSQLFVLALPLGQVHPTLPLLGLGSLALVAGYLGAMVHRPAADPIQSWGVAVTAAAVFGAPLLVLGAYLGSSIVFPIPGRYGFGLAAPMAMLLGVALRTRLAALILAVAVAGLVVVGPVVPPTRTDGPPPAGTGLVPR
jgi:hypothetical protein